MITIPVASVYVDDQDKALAFYTDMLGFQKRNDLSFGEARWLTVVSPAAPDGVELVLEPNAHPIAKTYQQALFEAGIPATALGTDDVEAEYERMTARGVTFIAPPAKTGPVTQAVFDDTCGNLILLTQAS